MVGDSLCLVCPQNYFGTNVFYFGMSEMIFNRIVDVYNTTSGENKKCFPKFEDTLEGYSAWMIAIPSQESLALTLRASKPDHF